MRALVLLVSVALLPSCGGGNLVRPTGPVDRQLVLAPGETGSVSEASLSIRFDGVFGDSRCPADVLCILGGDAIVRITVMPSGAERRSYDLHTGDMRPVVHEDVTIALVQLTPYPFSGRPVQPGEYRATLRVTR
jgi:hypothetical protein